jgi:hypothetical protein
MADDSFHSFTYQFLTARPEKEWSFLAARTRVVGTLWRSFCGLVDDRRDPPLVALHPRRFHVPMMKIAKPNLSDPKVSQRTRVSQNIP